MDYRSLVQQSIINSEGHAVKEDVLAVNTGKLTARCAHAKYIVDEPQVDIAWNDATQALKPSIFAAYWQQSIQHPTHTKCYTVGQAPYQLSFQLHTQLLWHQAFAENLFFTSQQTATWEIRCIPDYHPSQEHPELIAICFSEKKVLIAGTAYAGEIKKAMFTVMNYLLPAKNVLPMHCSAILNKQHETTLLLGLSGTGKTSLSAVGDFIIGDDEHIWSPSGILNLEAGCYAKCAHLTHTSEPQIFQAIERRSILENVKLKTGQPDFSDLSMTENIRAAFPLECLNNAYRGLAPHPKNMIFLSCDLFGVMPPVSKLNSIQAIEYFLCGYTARVGSTEVNGSQSIAPISSPCFGKPFFPRSYQVYADLLSKYIQQHDCHVWLVNTGWVNGDHQSKGRIPLDYSKAIIDAIIHHQISQDDLVPFKPLGLERVKTFKQQAHPVLYLDQAWLNSQQYANNLNTVKAFLQSTLGALCVS
ncbi:phosphoenolpyruvate carboxykinase (ATP) [Gammaproteobacteria bacterium]|nr:phosphoenolpyruvate carboxykinase (ATP) [Gammaproteobacteria bacterium]